jgi:hypothetical protein
MARKVLTYTVTNEGRDRGKAFVLTEMSALQAERWAMRAMMALVKSDVELPEDVNNLGLPAMAVIGIKAFGKMNFADAQPLLDEMMACVTFMPDPTKPQVVRRLIDDDIEEVTTRLLLRAEIFKLHVNFLPADAS